jgi:hypothetical protein
MRIYALYQRQVWVAVLYVTICCVLFGMAVVGDILIVAGVFMLILESGQYRRAVSMTCLGKLSFMAVPQRCPAERECPYLGNRPGT